MFVVKRALARLRVKDVWLANVDRNRSERQFIEYVGRFLPGTVPALRPSPPDRSYFAMEYLGAGFSNWKRMLLKGETHSKDAIQAGDVLGSIHAHSAGDAGAARLFDTTNNFTELRIEPYLLTTGRRHPDLQQRFDAEASRLAATRLALVHGDFSPKNILISSARFVLLDCEVAWYGDPAFDVAFLLTHLLLKSLYHAPARLGFDMLCRHFWNRYSNRTGRVLDLVSSRNEYAVFWL